MPKWTGSSRESAAPRVVVTAMDDQGKNEKGFGRSIRRPRGCAEVCRNKSAGYGVGASLRALSATNCSAWMESYGIGGCYAARDGEQP